MSLFLWTAGISPLVMQEKAASLLAIRGILYSVSFASFVYTLRGLNPISALLALHSGLICMYLLLRLCYLKEIIFNLTIGKAWTTVVFLTFAFYPGLSVVNQADFADESYPIRLYWQFTGIGFFAGMLLALVNSLTHKLAGGGLLRHEAQMSFWANATAVVILPAFIMLDFHLKEQAILPKDPKCNEHFEAQVLMGLFFAYLLKCAITDRSVMKRTVEDQPYDQDELSPIVERRESGSDDLERHRQADESQEEHHDAIYNRRKLVAQRRLVNLQVLAAPLLLCTYIFFSRLNKAIDVRGQAKIEVAGSVYAVVVNAIILSALTYYEDMLLLF